jgi:hypothetical protein
MTFTNNAEFETRVSAVIKSDGAWHVIDPDLDADPDAYNEFSSLGCDICHGGAGSVFTCTIVTPDVNCECDICSDCRYALEYGIDEN